MFPKMASKKSMIGLFLLLAAVQLTTFAPDIFPVPQVLGVVGQEVIYRHEATSYIYDIAAVDNWNPYNPIMMTHHFGQRSLLTEYLFYYNFWNGTLIPWLATGYEYSADYKTLTIKIRQGVKWSDGEQFTAKDVAFTVNMLIKDPACSYPDIVSDISRAYAKDDYTFVAEYKQPSPHAYNDYVLNYMLGLAIVPEHIFGPATTAGTGKMKPSEYEYKENIWTGPYKNIKISEDVVVFQRRDDWWAIGQKFWRLPDVKYVMFRKKGEEWPAMLKNEIDIATVPWSTFQAGLKLNPYLQWDTQLDPCPRGLYANLYKYPLSLKEVRNAIAHAINQTKLIEVGYEGKSTIAQFMAPTYEPMKKLMPFDWLQTAKGNFTGVKGSPYEGQKIEYSFDAAKYDLAMSTKILEGLGFKKVNGWWTSPNGTKCEWTLTNQMFWSPEVMAITQSVTEQLRNFGFDVVMKTPNFAESTQSAQMMQFDLMQGWLQQPVHPGNPQIFWPKYYSKAWVGLPTSFFSNFQHYNNSRFDELYLKAGTISDKDPKFAETQKEIFKVLAQDMPVILDFQQQMATTVNNYYWTNWPTSGDPEHPDISKLYGWPGHYQAHAHFVEISLRPTGRIESGATPSPSPTPTPIPTATPSPTPSPTKSPTPTPQTTEAFPMTYAYIAILVVAIAGAAGYMLTRRRGTGPPRT